MTVRRGVRVRSVVLVAAGSMLMAGACGGSEGSTVTLTGAAAAGQEVAATKGCAACHSADGSTGVGPTWKGAWGATVPLEDGGSATFDAGYVERAVRQPATERREGTSGQMPVFDTSRISDAELDSVVAYLQALGDTP